MNDAVDERLSRMDGKQKAFLSLTLAAEAFLIAALRETEKKQPGRAQASRVLLEDGKAHVCISIQLSRTELRARLALTSPEFVEVLSSYEMNLQGAIGAGLADPEKVSITDLGKMN